MQHFFTGDVVLEKTTKKEHIIHEAFYEGKGVFVYSTTEGAWFEPSEFVLIRRADSESFKQLDLALKEFL